MLFGKSQQRENCIQALQSLGLPMDRGWWARQPERAVEEVYLIRQNTNADLSCRDDAMFLWEVITTNFGTLFRVRIEARDFPFRMPEAFLESPAVTPDVKFHMYPNSGNLCLFHPNEWNSRFTLLKVRNHAASWCFCYEAAQHSGGIWPGAEKFHLL